MPDPGFLPSIKISVRTDDNILREGENPMSDVMKTAAPDLKLFMLSGKHALMAGYEGNWTSYDSNPRESYLDHTAKAELKLDLGMPYKLNILSGYSQSHEYRGYPGSRRAGDTGADRFTEYSAGAEFTMGERENPVQVYLLARGQDRAYTNNDQGIRDRRSTSLNLSFYLNAGPRTRVFLGGQSLATEYKSAEIYIYENFKNTPIPNLDSVDEYLFAGVQWEFSGLMEGTFRGGYSRKRMQSAQYQGYSGAALEFKLRWTPSERSAFVFQLGRRTAESNEIGASFILVNQGGVRFERELSARLSMSATLEHEMDSYTGIGRDDRYTFGRVELIYDALHWLKASAEYRSENRKSSEKGLDYKSNMFALVLTAEGI